MKKEIEKDRRTEKQKTGDSGEEYACRMIEKDGGCVIARKFRTKAGEIDIVALYPRENVIAFTEVKTRSGTEFGLPCQAVDAKKQARLLKSSELFLLKNPSLRALQPRMDVIEILIINGEVYGRMLKNAF